MKEKLAKITSASLEIQDRGILTFWIHVDYEEGCSQGVGGLTLDDYCKHKEVRVGSAAGCEVIRRLLLSLGVNDFSQMKGKVVWVIGDGDGLMFTPRGIRPLYVNDKDTEKDSKVIFADIFEEFKEIN